MAIRGIESATAETPEPDWYYAHDGEQAGPVDEDGLREAMAQGTLSESTLVWRTGMSDWTAASDVPALVGLFAAPAEDLTADVASADADADNNETQMVEMPEEFDSSQTPEQEAIAESEDEDATQMIDMTAVVEDSGDSPQSDESLSEEDAPQASTMDAIGQPLEFEEESAEENEASEEENAEENEAREEPVETAPIDSPVSESGVDSSLNSNATQPSEGIETAEGAEDDDLYRTIEAPSPWANYDNDEDDEDEDLVNKTFDDLVLSQQDTEPSETPDDNMVWERSENSVLFSLDDAPAPPSRRSTPGRRRSQPTSTDSSTESSLIDIGSFRKKKQSEGAGQDLFGSLAGSDSQIAANRLRAKGSQRHSSAGVLPGMRREKKASARMRTLGMLAAAILSGVVTTGIIFWAVGGPEKDGEDPKSQHNGHVVADNAAVTVPSANAPATKPDESPDNTADTPPTESSATPNDEKPAAATAETGDEGTAADKETADAKEAVPDEATKADTSEKPAAGASLTGSAPQAKAKPKTKKEKAYAKKARERAARNREKDRAARKKAKADKEANKEQDRRMAEARKKAEAERAAAAAKKAAAQKAKSADSDPNALLNKARQKKGTDLANTPSRLTTGQVRRVVRRANGRVRSCAQSAGLSGIRITVKFTIVGTGNVSGVKVTGPAAGTSAGPCVVSAINALRFPAFNGSQRVTYPFMVK